jgi:DNA-binding PadR family transcriptional regulator
MLRHITLNILTKEPISGTELMDEIEYYTDWRPSPGSVYPLLSKLAEQGLIELVESDDPTLKRYILTKLGIQLLEEYRKFEPNIRSRYHSIQKIYWKLFEGMDDHLFETYSRFLKAIEEIHLLIKDNPEASSMIQKLLIEASKKVEKIFEELEKQK